MYTIWEGLKRYPAALLLYALGIGAVEANRLGFLGRLLKTPILDDHHHEDRVAVQVLPPSLLVDGDVGTMRVLEGMNNHRLPLNDWMHKTLRPNAARIVPDDSRYTFVFDKLELLVGLGYIQAAPEHGWAPPGAFSYRPQNTKRVVEEIEASLSSRRDDSPFVRCGIFGDTEDVCRQRLASLRNVIGRTRW